MAHKTIKRLDTETRQNQIKKAVLDIIAKEGLAKLSTRNLAKHVGISEGAIFRHFPNKHSIILSILDDVKDEMIEELRLIAFSRISAEKRLYNFLCAHIKYLTKNRGITLLLFSEAAYQNDTSLKNELYEILGSQKIFISKIIEDGIKEGVWNQEVNKDNFAMLYMGIPITHNIEMILNNNTFTENEFCKSMICMIKRMLKK